MKLNDAIVKQKIRIIIFFSSILFYFPSRWHCIVLCWVLHLSSIELQQPQRRDGRERWVQQLPIGAHEGPAEWRHHTAGARR
jgi:hypothetical protein